MTVEFAAFEISDYLDDEKIIAEYLLAAADELRSRGAFTR